MAENVREVAKLLGASVRDHTQLLRLYIRRRIELGQYRGLAFGLILYPHFPPEVFLEGATTRTDPLSRDHHGPRAVLNALERLAGEPGPTMLELAERIKTLLTGQTIDATPQRTSAPRASMAAEPITERIRRRIDLALTA